MVHFSVPLQEHFVVLFELVLETVDDLLEELLLGDLYAPHRLVSQEEPVHRARRLARECIDKRCSAVCQYQRILNSWYDARARTSIVETDSPLVATHCLLQGSGRT